MNILEAKEVNTKKFQWMEILVQTTKPVTTHDVGFLGFDPGTVRFGAALYYPETFQARLYQVSIVRSKDAVERILSIQELLSSLFPNLDEDKEYYAIVEGASYNREYRQTELAEVRASIVLWCVDKGIRVNVVPPQIIRKTVFGKGNLLAHSVWKELEDFPDAAAALSCAFAIIV